jgi:putative transposase
MPWKQTEPMNERIEMVSQWLSGDYNISELSRHYGVSRRNVYKWLDRYEEKGWEGLEERSRAPHMQAMAIGKKMEGLILELKCRWPNWGAPKIRQKLLERMGVERCPVESTVSAVLKRHGLVKARKKRRHAVPGAAGPLDHCHGPNELWCADFKGWWKTLDGQRCEPLTVTDAWSRYLLKCVGLGKGTGTVMVKPHFEMLFLEHGLPAAIRTDNGSPFASTGLGGLTQLSVWWMRLGLKLERIEPGCPQQNGRHERMHLSLEQSQERAARANLALQQRALEKFRQDYNEHRPHEALAQRTPGELYTSSPRPYSGRLPAAREYPREWTTRQIRSDGRMKWGGQEINVTLALAGERIGLKPIDDGKWAVWFEQMDLGTFDERRGKIKGHKRLKNTARTEEQE